MKFFRSNFFLTLIISLFLTFNALAFEIKILVRVNDQIITNQDLNKEKIILRYFLNNEINDKTIETISLQNLIEYNVKKIEILKNKILVSENEAYKYLDIFLKDNRKSLDDFKLKLPNKIYEKHLINKVQAEISWNKLILYKFSSSIEINMDEILSKIKQNNIDSKKKNELILIEKNKKIQSISDSYYNLIKNNTLIKFE